MKQPMKNVLFKDRNSRRDTLIHFGVSGVTIPWTPVTEPRTEASSKDKLNGPVFRSCPSGPVPFRLVWEPIGKIVSRFHKLLSSSRRLAYDLKSKLYVDYGS